MSLSRTLIIVLRAITATMVVSSGILIFLSFYLEVDTATLQAPKPIQMRTTARKETSGTHGVSPSIVKKIGRLKLNLPLYDKRPPPPPPSAKRLDLEVRGTILEGKKNRAILRSNGRDGVYSVGETLEVDGIIVEVMDVSATTVTVKHDGQIKSLEFKSKSGKR